MGSLGDRSMHEFEDDSLFTPEAESDKIQRVHGLQIGSVSGDFPSSGNKILQNSVCRSIKTVVFSNKLNLLMPFGPLAIMVHNWTGHKVSSIIYVCWLDCFAHCCLVIILLTC